MTEPKEEREGGHSNCHTTHIPIMHDPDLQSGVANSCIASSWRPITPILGDGRLLLPAELCLNGLQ